MKTPGCFEILYADDNRGDIELTQEAARECGVDCRIHTVGDGAEAVAYLHNLNGGARPGLILLDWNMPRMNGLEALAAIRPLPEYAITPAIIFTSSGSEQHVRQAYKAGANCYVIKPMDLDQYMERVSALIRFWSQIACMPKIQL